LAASTSFPITSYAILHATALPSVDANAVPSFSNHPDRRPLGTALFVGTAVIHHSNQLKAVSRGARMLRTAFGTAIARFLEDPTIVEVMLNPDGRLWIATGWRVVWQIPQK
jgi:hypothetical protein